ncbi:MAG TPA: arsinothricin resistance N-acetyltransferase ArsN1 family B [Thermoanaerobaculia bacterium]
MTHKAARAEVVKRLADRAEGLPLLIVPLHRQNAEMNAAIIRLATSADGAAVAEIYRPAVLYTPISFELTPPDAREMSLRIGTTLERTPWIVCERAGDVIGYAYASRHRDRAAYQWSVEVSAYVREDARGCGVARALYITLFAVLEVQGFRNAFAGITIPNEASVRLHEAVGFTPIGVFRSIGYKQGSWHDVAWFERSLAPRITDPPDPTPLPAVPAETLTDVLRAGLVKLR